MLIMSLEIQIIEIAIRAIIISGTATFLAAFWGIPLGIIIGLRRFHGRSLVVSFFNAMLGMPTVALGLILYLIFSRSGPLGFLHLLYTPIAMILGQAVLVTPIMISFVTSTVESVDPEIKEMWRVALESGYTVLNTFSVKLIITYYTFPEIEKHGVSAMLGVSVGGWQGPLRF